MTRFILRRLLSTALVLLVVTFVLYLLLNVALDFFWDLRGDHGMEALAAAVVDGLSDPYAAADQVIGDLT